MTKCRRATRLPPEVAHLPLPTSGEPVVGAVTGGAHTGLPA
jgi:hypothetical protein